MHAAVTGATGLLGANLVVALRGAGHTVTATRRATSRTEFLDHLDLTWVEASLSDPAGLARAFEGADVVFHCAAATSIRRLVRPWIVEANVTGTQHVVSAVQASGARLVHCSSTVCIGVSTDGSLCTEETRWNFPERGLVDAYNATKRDAELVVRGAVATGLDAVIVNPGFMFGPYDQKPSSGTLLLELVAGGIPSAAPGRNSFVDVRDVAAGMLAAAERGRTGERYILGGHNLSYAELFARAARLAGVQPPRLRLPFALAQIGGWGGDVVEWATGNEPKVNSPAVRFGYERGFIVSSDKARRELGYQTRPVEDGIAAALDWFAEQGMLPRA